MEKLKFELIDSDDNVVEEVNAIDLEEALDLFVCNKKGYYMVMCENERVTEIAI